MIKLLTDLRNSFWFVPSLTVFVCAALAVAAIELDSIVGSDALSHFPRLFGAGAEGARELLSTIAGSTITVAGVVFSITIVALSLTAAQYSPRVLRNFMGDRANQLVLGVFVGAYVYCLLVLRTVRAGDEGFVPGISIVGALLLALVGIGFLIFFIHHIALSIQVSHIAARVSHDTISAIDKAYPKCVGNEEAPKRPAGEIAFAHSVASPVSGYIQQVDLGRLARLAREHGRIVRMEKPVGDFVVRGSAVMALSGRTPPERSLTEALLEAYGFNSYRDIHEDPASGLQQLVDIALKALSPGVNDVGTARNVLHYITVVLCELARRSVDTRREVCEQGELALLTCSRSFEQLLHESLSPIRQSAGNQPSVLVHLLSALAEIGHVAHDAEHRRTVFNEVRAVQELTDLGKMSREEGNAFSAALQKAFAAVGMESNSRSKWPRASL